MGEGPHPALHYGCVLPGSDVIPCGSISYITKRPFNGEVIRITTLGNRSFTVTANHPVMTDRGFVAAELIKQGDSVVNELSGNLSISSSQNNQMKSTIEDSFNSLVGSSKMVACPVPATTKDFHGDVTENEIGVVLVDIKLAHTFVATFAHKYVEHFLKMRESSALSNETSESHFTDFVVSLFASECCGVSFSSESFNFFGTGIIHAGLLLLASGSRGKAIGDEQSIDNASASLEVFCNASTTATRIEQSNNLIGWQAKMDQGRFIINTELGGKPVADAFADVGLSADFNRIEPFIQEFDAVINCERIGFSGHVYNLMTSEGIYYCNGIVTHNCRSIRIPVINTDVAMSVSGGSRVEPDGTKISARATYGGWLKDQPKAVQDEVLGVKRAELFRSDKLSIGKFTDDTGKVYTLEQLKEREPLAFS